MVFYRKYRPQKIEELDSEPVRNSLISILAAKEIPHAFLFYGPKGLGKTSAARILAKIVNCEQKTKPCNRCSQCVSIADGTNFDVLEIDAASNRGIDEIRDLREKIKLAPVSARRKVYIVDEAHMLTREAFNALLKTLEEPPKHVMFVLCTTEPEKLPETIASRCFAIAFKRAKEDEMLRALSRIIKREEIKIDKEAILKIIKVSEGSFRDGVKILEQIRALAGRKKITEQIVDSEFHPGQQIADFVGVLLKKDTRAALNLLEKMIEDGLNVKVLNEQLLYSIHGLLLNKAGVENKQIEMAHELEMEDLKRLLMLLEGAAIETKTAVIPQLPLELAIIEWGAERGVAIPHFSNLLGELIAKIKPYNHSVAGVLRGCKIKSYDGKKLVIETNYKFHKERLMEEKTRAILEKTCHEIMGNPIDITVLLKEE